MALAPVKNGGIKLDSLSRCKCDSKHANETCPLGESQLDGKLNGNTTSGVSKVLHALGQQSQSKKVGAPAHYYQFNDLFLEQGEIEQALKNGVECESCLVNSLNIIDQIMSSAEVFTIVEIFESSKREKSVQWCLRRDESKPHTIVGHMITDKAMIGKRRVIEPPTHFDVREHLAWKARKDPLIPDLVTAPERLSGYLTSLRAQLRTAFDEEPIYKIFSATEDLFTALYNAHTLGLLFGAQPLANLHEVIDRVNSEMFESLLQIAVNDPRSLRTTKLCASFIDNINKRLDILEGVQCREFLKEGVIISSKGSRGSYASTIEADRLPSITEYIVTFAEFIKASDEQGAQDHINRNVILGHKVLRTLGHLLKLAPDNVLNDRGEIWSAFRPLAGSNDTIGKQSAFPPTPSGEAKTMFGMSALTDAHFRFAASRIWLGVHPIANQMLVAQAHGICETLAQSLLADSRPSLDSFMILHTALGMLDRVQQSLGPLDWYLAQLDYPQRQDEFKPFRQCKCLPKEASNVLSHVLGPKLIAPALAIIYKKEEIELKEKSDSDAKAQAIMEALLKEETKKVLKKPKAKVVTNSKQVHLSTNETRDATASTLPQIVDASVKAESAFQGEKVKAMESNADLDEINRSRIETTVVKVDSLAHEGRKASLGTADSPKTDLESVAIESLEQEGEDEWQAVSTKKKNGSRKSAAALDVTNRGSSSTKLTERWTNSTVCEVSLPSSQFGLVVGEKNQRLKLIEKQSGTRIDVLPPTTTSSRNTVRFLNIRSSSRDATRKGVETIREIVDGISKLANNGGGVTNLESFTLIITHEDAQRLMRDKGSALQKEISCTVSLKDPSQVADGTGRLLVITGLPDRIIKAKERLQVLEKAYKAQIDVKARPQAQKSEFAPQEAISGLVSENSTMELDANFPPIMATVARDSHVQKPAAVQEELLQPQGERPFERHESATTQPTDLAQTREPVKTVEPEVEKDDDPDDGFQPVRPRSSARNTPTRPSESTLRVVQHVPAPTQSSRLIRLEPAEVEPTITGTWQGGRMQVEVNIWIKGKLISHLNKIQAKTGTKIDVEDESSTRNNRRVFSIQGSQRGAKEALLLLQKELGDERSFYLPRAAYDRAFEEGGRYIRTFEESTKTRIVFNTDASRRVVTIIGDLESIKKARFLFENLVAGFSPIDAIQALKTIRPGKPLEVYQALASQATVKGIAGLSNSRGENNCFLNVVIQSLFHFTNFSDRLLSDMQDHAGCRATGDNKTSKCIVCCLVKTFRGLKQSAEGTSVSSVELREAVAEAFEGQFDLGAMEDAAEAFEKILEVVHQGICDGEPESGEACKCLVHRSFSSCVFEGVRCPHCLPMIQASKYQTQIGLSQYAKQPQVRQNATYHGLLQIVPKYECLVRYVSATMIAALAEQPMSFELKVKHTMEVNPRSCPACDRPGNPVEIVVTRVPSVVFSLGLVWASETPDYENEVYPVLETIQPNFDLALLSKIRTLDCRDDVHLRSYPTALRGIICFNRKHYVAYFRKTSSADWFKFDDATVMPAGSSWMSVKATIESTKFQPVVLFYEARAPVY